MEAKNQAEVEALRNSLKQLSNFSSWHLIRNELETIVLDLEQGLFKTDAKANEKVFTKHDIQRAERKILKLLINLPSDLFDELRDYDEIEQEED